MAGSAKRVSTSPGVPGGTFRTHDDIWAKAFPGMRCSKHHKEEENEGLLNLYLAPGGVQHKHFPQYEILIGYETISDPEKRYEANRLGLGKGDLLLGCTLEEHERWVNYRREDQRAASSAYEPSVGVKGAVFVEVNRPDDPVTVTGLE